jgi:hypothetical protein
MTQSPGRGTPQPPVVKSIDTFSPSAVNGSARDFQAIEIQDKNRFGGV